MKQDIRDFPLIFKGFTRPNPRQISRPKLPLAKPPVLRANKAHLGVLCHVRG